MAKDITNEELISHIMNYCPTGALSQVFVIYAVEKYAKEVMRDEKCPFDAVINTDAWINTAKYIDTQIGRS